MVGKVTSLALLICLVGAAFGEDDADTTRAAIAFCDEYFLAEKAPLDVYQLRVKAVTRMKATWPDRFGAGHAGSHDPTVILHLALGMEGMTSPATFCDRIAATHVTELPQAVPAEQAANAKHDEIARRAFCEEYRVSGQRLGVEDVMLKAAVRLLSVQPEAIDRGGNVKVLFRHAIGEQGMASPAKYCANMPPMLAATPTVAVMARKETPAAPPGSPKPPQPITAEDKKSSAPATGAPTAANETAAAAQMAAEQRITKLSETARSLRSRMSRTQVLKALGQPTWVLLPSDNSEFAPKSDSDVSVSLIWKNGLCASVVADFNKKGQLIGWDEGRGGCVQSEAEAAEFNPPNGQFSCAEGNRAVYCNMARTQAEAGADVPVTATEIAAARKALCQAIRETGNLDSGIPRANQIYQALTGQDFDRTLEVMSPQFSGLISHEWSCR